MNGKPTLRIYVGAAVAMVAAASCGQGGEGDAADDVTVKVGAMSSTPTPWTDTLAANRERLIADWAARMGYDKCGGWAQLNCNQKGAFLSPTHRLQVNRVTATGLQALDHVDALYGIAPGQGCGGEDGNRIFVSM